jgi:Kdo2-lipid IVA lauroyltransferase/acyltransferase
MNIFLLRIKFAPFYLLSLLPLNILYLFSNGISSFLYHVLKYRRKVVFDNLRNSFPDKKLSELLKIEKGFYQHFCDIFIEAVKILTISKAQVKKRFKVKNPEVIEGLYKKEKSAILYAAHLGNWEWMASLPLHIPHQFLSFYQAQSNTYFDELMILIRERFNNICVESKSGYKTLMNYSEKNQLTLTCMIGDQSPALKSTKHWTIFLHQETAFLIGAARLAQKCQQVLVYPRMTEIKRGYYEFEFIVMEDNDDSREMINAYAKLLEENITAQPTLWLWSHRRWKLKNKAIQHPV